MNFKKISLFILIILLFIGISFATEHNNDTTSTDKTSVAKDTNNNEYKDIVKKDYNTKNVKKTSNTKTYNVTKFKTLQSALTSDKYSDVTLNIKSNIILTEKTHINDKIHKLVIEGNGKIINGNNKTEFLEIPKKTSTTINNIKITKCHSTTVNATILNQGKLTINNSTLNNNRGNSFGLILNEGKLTINNSTLNNNRADYYGGAVFNSGTLTINKSTLNNNTAYSDEFLYHDIGGGGAIFNNGNVSIKASTLNNNKVTGSEGYGGAICNSWGFVSITNTTLNNNTAKFGGSIGIGEGNVVIKNSILNNNNASAGGAILNNWGSINITKTTLNKNKASYGGALYNIHYFFDIAINDSTFNDNRAANGGAIYTMSSDNYEVDFYEYIGKINIKNTTFKKNKASQIGGAIDNEGVIKIVNSTFNANTAKNSSHDISNEGKLILIDINYHNSTKSIVNYNCIITSKDNHINKIKNHRHIQFLTRLGKNERNFTYLDKLLHSGKSQIKLNYDIKLDVWNDEDDKFKTGIELTKNNIKLLGNNHVINSQGSRIFVNNANTTIKNVIFTNGFEISGGAILNYNNLTLESDVFKNNYALSSGATIYNFHKLNIKNCKFTNNTGPEGGGAIFNEGNLNVTKSKFINNSAGAGGAIYDLACNNKIKYNEFTNNHARLYGSAIYNVYYEPTDRPTVVSNNFLINNSGKRKYVIYADKTENINVKNNLYDEETKNVKISVNKIGNIRYRNNVTIKGKLVSVMGKVVKNVTVRIKVNDKTFKVKTNDKGIFKYVTKTMKTGTNSIIVRFPGNKDFNTKTMKTSFKVIKQNVKITVNKISNVKRGKTVVITGKFTNANGMVFANCNLKVKINKKTVYVKTNKNGVYTYNIKASSLGTNKVSVIFNGNKNYNAYTATRSFKVTR